MRETPPNGWERVGSFGAYAPRLRATLVRLFWLAANPEKPFHQMPLGWMQNQMPDIVEIVCENYLSAMRSMMGEAFWGSSTVFLNWLTLRLKSERPTFERAAIAKDLQDLTEFFTHQNQRAEKRSPQLVLL